MAKVTIETHELTLSKTVNESGRIDTANVVLAVADLVAALEVAHSDRTTYGVRQHLLDSLQARR